MGLFSRKPSLKDETVKKYYEMIYGMRSGAAWAGNESAEGNSRAHRYVEFMLGGPCDAAKLKDAVELINTSRTDYPKSKLENQLKEYNKELKTLNKYTCDRSTAYKVCYPELLDEVKAQYNKVLDVVKDYDDVKHFGCGIHNQIKESEEWKRDLVRDCFFIAMLDSLLEENPVTIKNLCDLFIDVLYNIKNKRLESMRSFASLSHSIALRALKFEKHGKKRDGYATLTLEESQELVLRAPIFLSVIEKHPFEKEKYIKKFAEEIKKDIGFCTYNSSYYKQYCYFDECFLVDDYFDDAMCYYIWREIAKEYVGATNENDEDISESRDPIDIVNMLYDYINNL